MPVISFAGKWLTELNHWSWKRSPSMLSFVIPVLHRLPNSQGSTFSPKIWASSFRLKSAWMIVTIALLLEAKVLIKRCLTALARAVACSDVSRSRPPHQPDSMIESSSVQSSAVDAYVPNHVGSL